MTIAVTGATGFIGRVLTPLLSEHSVRALTRGAHSAGSFLTTLSGVTAVPGDLLDPPSLDRLVAGAEVVIHIAASVDISDSFDPRTFAVNVDGTASLLEAARAAGVRRFIYISSVAAFEQAPYDSPLDPTRPLCTDRRRPYDFTKACAQALVLSSPDMEVIVLAPTAVLGPFDRAPSLLGKAVIAMRRGRVPALFPGGVDFVDVRDVAAAIASAIVAGIPGRVYLLAGGWAPLSALNTGRRIPVVPLWLIWLGLPFVKLWALFSGGAPYYTQQAVYNVIYSNRRVDASFAALDLGFRARPLSETLNDTIAWFQQQGMLSSSPAG